MLVLISPTLLSIPHYLNQGRMPDGEELAQIKKTCRTCSKTFPLEKERIGFKLTFLNPVSSLLQLDLNTNRGGQDF